MEHAAKQIFWKQLKAPSNLESFIFFGLIFNNSHQFFHGLAFRGHFLLQLLLSSSLNIVIVVVIDTFAAIVVVVVIVIVVIVVFFLSLLLLSLLLFM